MDLKKLHQILTSKNIYVKETNDNYICKCIYCGDHPDPRKAGHLYVSKNPKIPTCHCFFCDKSRNINGLVYDITKNRKEADQVISKQDIINQSKKIKKISTINDIVKFKLPELDINKFPDKSEYIKDRTDHKLNPILLKDNLIFDFEEFFSKNKINSELKPKKEIIYYLQKHYVGFISDSHKIIFCRNIVKDSKFKFRKIPLQKSELPLLDFVSFKGHDTTGNTLVLSEGTFDILGEYVSETVINKNDVYLYAAGQSWSYSSLIKSIAYHHSLFNVNVIILSDKDKKVNWYNKFIKQNDHIIKDIKIFYNRNEGGDFGSFPIRPVESAIKFPDFRNKKYENYKIKPRT